MRFPWTINEPTTNLAVLSKLRVTLVDGMVEGDMDWTECFIRLREAVEICKAIRDSNATVNQRGEMQDLLDNIFSSIHSTATVV